MSSFSEFNSTIDYRSTTDDHNGYIQRDCQERRYRQQRNGKRFPGKNLERQLSDKHLKRRAQIIKVESNNNINRRHLHQHTITTSTSSSSLSFHDHDQQYLQQQLQQQYQYQYHWHRRPDHGGFFFVHNKKRSIFMILLLFLLLLLVLLLSIPTIWCSTLLSMSPIRIQTMSAIIMGGNKNNYQEYRDSDGKKDNYNNETIRTYQDLANSIRMLRIRRQVLKEETAGEREERIEERQLTNSEKIDYDNGDHVDPTKNMIIDVKNNHDNGNDGTNDDDDEEEDVRLKRLEQKIQMDQNKKVRQEFSLSNKIKNNENYNDRATNRHKNNENENHGIDEISAGNSELQQQDGRQHIDHQDMTATSTNTTALKYKVMSENIAALKLFNDNNNKKSNEN